MNIKQGETFSLTGQYLDDDGITPKSLAGVILRFYLNGVEISTTGGLYNGSAVGNFGLVGGTGDILYIEEFALLTTEQGAGLPTFPLT